MLFKTVMVFVANLFIDLVKFKPRPFREINSYRDVNDLLENEKRFGRQYFTMRVK